MGYQRSTLKLIFADPDMEGLEVRSERLSVEGLLLVARLGALDRASLGDQVMALAQVLAQTLLTWNLEDRDGNPVPLTVEGLMGRDVELLRAIADALMVATNGVSPPLPQPSPDGEPFLEASIPMETLSPSLLS